MKKFMDKDFLLKTETAKRLYHWTHLELRRYFGIEELLCPENAEKIWNKCNEMLKKPEFDALLSRMVRDICYGNTKNYFSTDKMWAV